MVQSDRQAKQSDSPALNPFPEEDLSLVEDAVLPPPTPGLSLLLDPGERALRRLISNIPPASELVSLIEAIFSSSKATDAIGGLTGRDAQIFIDAIDEVTFTPFQL